jgi:hypothetical protein
MNELLAAFYETVRRWRLLLVVMAATLVWVAAFFLWLGIPVAAGWQIAGQAVAGVVLAGAPIAMLVFLYRTVGGKRFQPGPSFAVALAGALFLGGYAPYRLIWWIPAFAALPAQAVSMAARFLAALLLFSFAVLWMVVIAAGCYGKDISTREQ